MGAGAVALAAMPWAIGFFAMTPIPRLGPLWVMLLAPCIGCLAAGVALVNAPIPRWLAVVVLGLFIMAMPYYVFLIGASAPGAFVD